MLQPDGYGRQPSGPVPVIPAVSEELVRRGYSEKAISKILGGNVLRVMAEAEAVARHLQSGAP